MNTVSPAKIITQESYQNVRSASEYICDPLEIEDYVAQPSVDVSPPRWHLAHTTWFFEKFILNKFLAGYKNFHPKYHFLFNSYYVQAGERWQRGERGYLTRPTVGDILNYRKYVDQHMAELISSNPDHPEIRKLVELGLQHEQQHQELLLYDIKYILGHNPLFPVYRPFKESAHEALNADWAAIPSGNYQIGYKGDDFHFDNEMGVHTVFLHDFEIQNRLVSKGEFLEFMNDGGYENTPLWLDEGAKWVAENEIKCPMYWIKDDTDWMEYTLSGLQPLNLHEPLVHVSFYEADAFARWRGVRLPTEQEWEIACEKTRSNRSGNFRESEYYRTVEESEISMFGNVWQWTSSAYRPYPFYKAPDGALGEYNGKFMINQMVLRGGSFGTPKDHIRSTYRNFFHPHLRWHFAGLRLARDI